MKSILISIVLLALLSAWAFMFDAFLQDQAMYKSEGKCIAALIAREIERKDIGTADGTCYVITPDTSVWSHYGMVK